MALTSKQEKYVQGLVAGLSQREAYKQAYDASRMKPETIGKRASENFQKGEIRGRYNELMNEHKQKALWTREESVSTLKWLIATSVESIKGQDKGYVRQGTSNAIISAIKELNELELLYPLHQAQIEKLRDKSGDSGDKVVFVESEEEMLKYMEENSNEYNDIDK